MPIRGSSKAPKYLKLARKLTKDIETGALKPGDRLPSFDEMRAHHGVAINTADRVFLLLEQKGLVQRKPGQGIFVAEPQSSFSKRSATGLIGYIGGDFRLDNTSYTHCIMRGIRQVLSGEEKEIVLLEGDSSRGLEKVDGILVCSTCRTEPILRQLPPQIPCVSLLLEMPDVASVVADDYAGAKIAVEHLVELGHRRIGALMEFPLPLPRLRLAGYQDAMTAAGLVLDPRWMRQLSPAADKDYLQSGHQTMQRWLHDDWRQRGCTALLAQNDRVAAGVIKALRQAAIAVPEEVSVIGFDDTEICQYVSPHITSVAVPLQEIGAAAAEILLQQIQADTVSQETRVLPVTLTLRESTARAADA